MTFFAITRLSMTAHKYFRGEAKTIKRLLDCRRRGVWWYWCCRCFVFILLPVSMNGKEKKVFLPSLGWLAGTATFHTEQEQTVNKYATRKTTVLFINTVWECFAWRLHPRLENRLERLLLLACLLGKFVSLGTLVEQLWLFSCFLLCQSPHKIPRLLQIYLLLTQKLVRRYCTFRTKTSDGLSNAGHGRHVAFEQFEVSPYCCNLGNAREPSYY